MGFLTYLLYKLWTTMVDSHYPKLQMMSSYTGSISGSAILYKISGKFHRLTWCFLPRPWRTIYQCMEIRYSDREHEIAISQQHCILMQKLQRLCKGMYPYVAVGIVGLSCSIAGIEISAALTRNKLKLFSFKPLSWKAVWKLLNLITWNQLCTTTMMTVESCCSHAI